ncbi:MAG: hypothetical protein HFH72_09370 [Lachnospiraceae bacterium]|nr:hypothetical protein [Lachnospiraceae bacterium]
MSRVNKYRGIHTHVLPQNEHLSGRWVYGYLADENYINSPELEGEFLVDKDTVGQYIGVKDKNGKEIYDGDIVKTKFFGKDDGKGHNFNDYDLFEITYIDGSFILENKTRQFSASYLTDMSGSGAAEVVGNVYENADLLKEVE